MTSKSKKILNGMSWLMAITWYSKVAGMVSFVILARYLDKNDFGIIAGCFVAQGFFGVLSNLGTRQYLIRKKEINNVDIDVAWTINLTTRTIIAIAFFLLSGFVASFLKIPELELPLKVMALVPFIIGFHNPALSVKIKKLEYSQISYMSAIVKTISTSVTLFIVIIYKTYWAVVISEIVYQLAYAIGSFIIIKYRPKLRFREIGKQWNYSKWVLFKGIVSYGKYNCDRIIIGRNFSVPDLGIYNFSKEAASSAVILVSPIAGIFYPSLSDYAYDKTLLVDKIYKYLALVAIIYIPMVFGGIFLSDVIVPVVFGEKWVESIAYFDVFLIMTFSGIYNQLITQVFELIGEVKRFAIYEVLSSIVTIAFIYFLSSFSLLEFSMGRTFIAYMSLICIILFLSTMIPISLLHIIELLSIPIFSSLTMIYVISLIEPYVSGLDKAIELLVLISIGFIVYLLLTVFFLRLLSEKLDSYKFIYQSLVLKAFCFMQNKLTSRI